MKWQSASMVILSVIALTACVEIGPKPPDTAGCPVGRSPYQAADVALRIGWDTSEGSSRLPLGKVVVAAPGMCVQGDALQALGAQRPPSSPGGSAGQAFRAVTTGVAKLYWNPTSCGEACMKSTLIRITVTDGCQPLSRQDVTRMSYPPYPLQPAQSISAKL